MTPAAAVVACSSRRLGDSDAANMTSSYLYPIIRMRDKDRPSDINSIALWYRTLLHYGIGNTFGLVRFANQLSETQEKSAGFTIHNYMIYIAETNGATAVLPYRVRARPEPPRGSNHLE